MERITMTAGQPLRIAVYERVASAIRRSDYPLGSPLPSDAEFSAQLGISRTVVREAFLLLEEDGLIRTKRGVGRFVADTLPTVGLERLEAMETVLAAAGEPITVERVSRAKQVATGFIAARLGMRDDDAMWAVESVIRRDGQPVCASFESLRVADGPLSSAQTEAVLAGTGTILNALLQLQTGLTIRSRCELIAGTAGSSRAEMLGVPTDSSVLIITQYVDLGGEPAYLAKHATTPAAGAMSLTQSVMQ